MHAIPWDSGAKRFTIPSRPGRRQPHQQGGSGSTSRTSPPLTGMRGPRLQVMMLGFCPDTGGRRRSKVRAFSADSRRSRRMHPAHHAFSFFALLLLRRRTGRLGTEFQKMNLVQNSISTHEPLPNPAVHCETCKLRSPQTERAGSARPSSRTKLRNPGEAQTAPLPQAPGPKAAAGHIRPGR
jgi:hypothetical protein